ncbi:MAG: hypothetical protein J5585_03955 [Clostridia bacterium]|nr:hypothetical protein [Clostridia bacterium]
MGLGKLLGIAAGAAAAGIGAVVVKALKNNHEEEQERLEMEYDEQLHRQSIEQQKLSIEQQKLSEEIKQREHQRWLESAPKKPIYKSVSMICPRCMGHCEIDQEKDQLVCPYCDYTMHLTVDHYEIDREKLEAQEKAAEEQRIQREKKRNSLIIHLSLIGILCVALTLAIVYRSFLGIYLCILLISLLLMHLYPKMEFLLWGVLLPLPLSTVLLSSKKINEKLGRKKTILLVIGIWLVFIGIIASMLFIDIHHFKQ